MFPTATTKAARTFTNKDLDTNQLPEGLTPADDNSQLPDGLTPVPDDDLSYKGPGLNPAANYLRKDFKPTYTGDPNRKPADSGPDTENTLTAGIARNISRITDPLLKIGKEAGPDILAGRYPHSLDALTDTFTKPFGPGEIDQLKQHLANPTNTPGEVTRSGLDMAGLPATDVWNDIQKGHYRSAIGDTLATAALIGATHKLGAEGKPNLEAVGDNVAGGDDNGGGPTPPPSKVIGSKKAATRLAINSGNPNARVIEHPSGAGYQVVYNKTSDIAPVIPKAKGPVQGDLLTSEVNPQNQFNFEEPIEPFTSSAKQLNLTDEARPEPTNQGALNLEPSNPKFSDKWTNSELFPSGQHGGLNEVTPEPEPEISTKGSGPVPPAEPKPENITNEDWNGIQPDRGPQYESPTKVTPEAIVDSLPDAKDGVKVSPFPKADDSVIDEMIRNKQINYADPHLEDVPLHNLVGTQDTVDPEIVKHYVNEEREPLSEVPSENKGRMDDKAPVVIKVGDENVLAGGHHRATADLVNGKDTMQAVVYNADVPPDLLAKFKASLEKDRAGRTLPEEPVDTTPDIVPERENKSFLDGLPDDALQEFVDRHKDNPGYDTPTGRGMLKYANDLLAEKAANPEVPIASELPKGPEDTNLTPEDKANVELWFKYRNIYKSGKMTPEQMVDWANLHNKVKELKPNGSFTVSPYRFDTLPEDEGPTHPDGSSAARIPQPEDEAVAEEPGLAEKATSRLQEIEDTAKQRIKDRGTFGGGRLSSGLPVDDLVDIAKIGAAKIGKGLVNFADWSADMIKDFGDAIKPHLENIFKVARSYHQAAGDINESIDESRSDGDHVKQIEELLQKRNGQSGSGRSSKFSEQSTNPESEVAGTSQNGIQSNAGSRRTGVELTQEFNRPLNGAKTTNAQVESEAAQAHPAESQSPQVIKQIKQTIPQEEIPNRIGNISNHLDEALKSKKISPEDKENIVTKALNFQRTLLSSMNLHAPGRQGLPLIWHPAWWKAWAPMVKSYGSEGAYKLVMSSIDNDPSGFFKKQSIMNQDGSISKRPPVSFADRAGLDLTDIESHREEIFRSQIAQKYIPLVGRSTRAYTAYLNKLRADVFSDLVKKAGAQNDIETAKKIADFVNVATGRGNLGGFEPSASAVSQIFFSPRKMAADAQMFTRTLNPYYYKSVPPVVRMAQLKSALATAGTGLLLGQLAKQAGATVDDNPDSTDYGKIKFGNTRIDPFAGHQQYVVAAARMLQGKSTSSFTGKTHQLNTGKFGSQTAQDIATRFVSNKLAPVPSMVWNWMGGKEFDGTPFNIKQELLEHTAPLVTQDLYHIWKEDPDIVPGSIMSGSAGIGFGVQTYGR